MNVQYTERGQGSAVADFLSEHAQDPVDRGFFAVCVIFFSVMTEAFLTVVVNLLKHPCARAAPILVVAVAMTYVITHRRDRPVGRIAGRADQCRWRRSRWRRGWLPWPLVVLAMLGAGRLHRAGAGLVRRLSGHSGPHRGAVRGCRSCGAPALLTQGFVSIPGSCPGSGVGRGSWPACLVPCWFVRQCR